MCFFLFVTLLTLPKIEFTLFYIFRQTKQLSHQNIIAGLASVQ